MGASHSLMSRFLTAVHSFNNHNFIYSHTYIVSLLVVFVNGWLGGMKPVEGGYVDG